MHAADTLFSTLQLRSSLAPDELARRWAATDARGLAELVAWEQAVAWTLRRLSQAGSAAAAPPAFVDALKQRARKESALNLLVDAETSRITQHLARESIPFVLIKGTARRALAGRYPCIEARGTSDVDILLPGDAARRAWDGLRAAGYQPSSDERPHHLAPLLGEGRVAVELHTSLAHEMPPDEAWRRMTDEQRTVEWNGAAVRVPSATELLWHGLAHAFKELPPAPFRLRHFLDAASLLAGSDTIRWDTLRARLATGEITDAGLARAWLGAAAQLAGAALPDDMPADGPRFDVPGMLRWRLHVLSQHTNEGYGARLLEEGARVELGLKPAEGVPGSGVLKQTRRWLGGRAARTEYLRWRAREGRAEQA